MCNRIQIRALVFHISQSDSFIYMETASFCDNRLSVCRPYFIVWLKGTQSSIPFISFMPLQTVFTSSLSFACARYGCVDFVMPVACYCCFCHIRDRSIVPPIRRNRRILYESCFVCVPIARVYDRPIEDRQHNGEIEGVNARRTYAVSFRRRIVAMCGH